MRLIGNRFGVNRRFAFAVALVLGAGAALIWLYQIQRAPQAVKAAVVEAESATLPIEAVSPRLKPLIPKGPQHSDGLPIRELGAFVPGEVIDNPDCRMLAGRGSASDVALVVVPTEKGSHFAVLDGRGEVFSDRLPYMPHHYQLGKRADGSVLVGLGDLRLNSKVFRDPAAPERMRIYMDGQVIYENAKAWQFAVAPDGSSFYVHEPLAGAASRLVVRNLDHRTEQHFDLDSSYTPHNDHESGFGSAYSTGSREVMFSPVYEYGRGVHRFFPVVEGEVREVHVARDIREQMHGGSEDRVRIDGVSGAVFASSEEGYVAMPPSWRGQYWRGRQPWRIERRNLDHDADTTSVVWSREVDLDHFSSSMTLSGDGAWLALRAWTFKVLDTASGETVFEYPKVDKRAELARLGSVLGPAATVSDVGGVTNEYFRDNRLVFFRQVGIASTRTCSGKRGEAYDDCISDLRKRGVYNSMVDVFEMDGIQMDSQPDFRREVGRDNLCASGDYALRGLQVHDDRLTFLTTRR